jgi:hypothetical protein
LNADFKNLAIFDVKSTPGRSSSFQSLLRVGSGGGDRSLGESDVIHARELP